MSSTDMGDSMLEYIETQRDDRICLKFKKICPLSSGTFKEQQKYLDPEGLSLVAFLSQIIKMLKENRWAAKKELP